MPEPAGGSTSAGVATPGRPPVGIGSRNPIRWMVASLGIVAADGLWARVGAALHLGSCTATPSWRWRRSKVLDPPRTLGTDDISVRITTHRQLPYDL